MQIRQGCFCALKVFEILSFLHSRLIKYTFIREGKFNIVKLRQGSGKDGQGMAVKAKGLIAGTLAKSLH